MLLKKYIVFAFLFLIFSALFAYTTNERYSSAPSVVDSDTVEFIAPKKIMLKYYEAVDKGELIVFGIQLDRTMLIPVRVDYAYPVNGQIPRIKVYAELKKPIRIPEQGNNVFTAVCAVIDMFGNIVETEAHIFIK